MKKLIIALMLIAPTFASAAVISRICPENLNAFQAFLWYNNAVVDHVTPDGEGYLYVEFHTENATQAQLRTIVDVMSKI